MFNESWDGIVKSMEFLIRVEFVAYLWRAIELFIPFC